MEKINFLRNEKFKVFINEYTKEKFLDFLFFFKGEEDQFMSFVEAVNVLGTQIDQAYIFPAKAKIIRPIERMKYFQKLLEDSDYDNPNERFVLQTCRDLAKRRSAEEKEGTNRLTIKTHPKFHFEKENSL